MATAGFLPEWKPVTANFSDANALFSTAAKQMDLVPTFKDLTDQWIAQDKENQRAFEAERQYQLDKMYKEGDLQVRRDDITAQNKRHADLLQNNLAVTDLTNKSAEKRTKLTANATIYGDNIRAYVDLVKQILDSDTKSGEKVSLNELGINLNYGGLTDPKEAAALRDQNEAGLIAAYNNGKITASQLKQGIEANDLAFKKVVPTGGTMPEIPLKLMSRAYKQNLEQGKVLSTDPFVVALRENLKDMNEDDVLGLIEAASKDANGPAILQRLHNALNSNRVADMSEFLVHPNFGANLWNPVIANRFTMDALSAIPGMVLKNGYVTAAGPTLMELTGLSKKLADAAFIVSNTKFTPEVFDAIKKYRDAVYYDPNSGQAITNINRVRAIRKANEKLDNSKNKNTKK